MELKLTKTMKDMLLSGQIDEPWLKCNGIAFTFGSTTKVELLHEGKVVVEMEYLASIRDGQCLTLFFDHELRLPLVLKFV